MGSHVRAADWRDTPLGARDAWPQSLRTAVGMMLESRFPTALLWGRELALVYNDAYRTIAGDRHPCALGRATRDVWPEIWHLVGPLTSRVVDRGESVYLEDQLFPIDRGGRLDDAYFTLSYSPVRLEDGTVGGVLLAFIETTSRVRERDMLERERVRAESEAKRERELFAKVVARIPVMVAVYDPALRSFHLNEELETVLGWNDEDARAHDLMTLCYPDPEYRASVQEFMQSVEPGWREFRVRTKDGREVESSWANVRLSDDTQVGIGVDLPAQRRVNAQLREAIEALERERGRLSDSEAQLRALYEHNPAIVALSELEDGRIVDVNGSFTRLLGFTAEEARGRTAAELGIVTGAPLRDRVLDAVGATGSARNLEVSLRTKSGAELEGLLSSTIVELGGRRRLITVIADITELEHARQALRDANTRLEEADRRKDEFLAVLSHELRNPLAPIRHSVYLLQHAAPGSAPADRAIAVIGRQADHMTRLVDDLLDVTRISRGKITLHRERVDLVRLVRGTVEDHREQYARAGVALEMRGPDEALWVDGDATRLVQVVGNLLNNSVKFTPQGGHTVVSVATTDGHATVRVRDDGAGMRPDTVEQLFEPFVQAPQTLARSRGGLGLGLALVKALVEMHGGAVVARSEGEGRGAELVVTLPRVGPPSAVAVAPRAERVARARRVLVVEDNIDAAEMLRELLELRGHEVTMAHTGPGGVAAARACRPDVVLCDIGLPELDGYGVARALRDDADPGVQACRLVALSGYAQPEDVARSIEAGFDGHVAKPPSLETLDGLLAELE